MICRKSVSELWIAMENCLASETEGLSAVHGASEISRHAMVGGQATLNSVRAGQVHLQGCHLCHSSYLQEVPQVMLAGIYPSALPVQHRTSWLQKQLPREVELLVVHYLLCLTCCKLFDWCK